MVRFDDDPHPEGLQVLHDRRRHLVRHPFLHLQAPGEDVRREAFGGGRVRDRLFAWGFFSEILQRVEYMEPYAIAPMAERMLDSDPELKAEFEKRLRDDEGFAASPLRRLQFFYERSPFYDERYLLYPVGREL